MTLLPKLPADLLSVAFERVRKLATNNEWLSDTHNKELVKTVISRKKQPYYNFMPYMNRSDGSPSWQWQFLLNANYKGRVALGANRIGKTTAGAYECCLAVTGDHPIKKYPDNGIGWIVGLDNPMIRDIDRPLFEEFLPNSFKHKFYKQDNIWELRGNGREWTVIFKSGEMGRDKFQGAAIDFCWLDEELKNTDIFSEIERGLVDRRGNFWITATPVRGTRWLKEISEREDVFTTFAGMRENPHIPIDEVEKYAKTLDDDERMVRIEGQYLIFGGRPVFDIRLLNALLSEARKEPSPLEGKLIEAA